MKKSTQAVHIPFHRPDPYGALSHPVYHSVAYEFDTAREMADAFCNRIDAPDYSRVENPTVIHLEEAVQTITGSAAVSALNSGMAAVSNTLIAVSGAGKNIVTSRHLFGNSYSLITSSLARFGVGHKLCDLTCPGEVEAAIDAETCCIYLEIVTNPQLEVADLRELAAIAHRHHIPLIADTTVIPFTEFSAKALGVDIEVVSSTKYVSGGATCLGGLVIDYGTTPGFSQRMKGEMVFNYGAYMTPQVAYMQTLGLETLGCRYARQASSTLQLAHRLREIPQIKHVNYVGLEDNPYHQLAVSQFGPTAGAMLTFDMKDEEACFRLIDHVRLICRATNLFDNRSLIIHPASTIFGAFSDEEKRAMDVDSRTIRLSVGLEDVDDLYDDLRQAAEQ